MLLTLMVSDDNLRYTLVKDEYTTSQERFIQYFSISSLKRYKRNTRGDKLWRTNRHYNGSNMQSKGSSYVALSKDLIRQHREETQ